MTGDIVSNLAEGSHLFFFSAHNLGGIGEAQVETFSLPQPDRALLCRRIAHRDDAPQIEGRLAEFFDRLGISLVGDPNFSQGA